ncbi:S8 family serine peptidase [Ferruginibacter yonginensis]|uniref:S8 family serine peptidase n=1 Tax=Ferruginibacter yonginensis TaxID=1310416 RepID=A0ABV8QRL2_9BACT
MKKVMVLMLLLGALVNHSYAQQTRYLIKFKDKGSNPFSLNNPSQYLSTRALQRRTRYNIGIDSLDLPVTPRYVDSVRLAGAVTILNTSKWLNEVAIKTSDATALAKINNLPFVVSVVGIASFTAEIPTPVNKNLGTLDTNTAFENTNSFIGETTANVYNYGRSNGQVQIHQGAFLHNHGFRGETMQIAVLDGGFFHYQTLPTFDSVRANNQIINTWDFVANNASVDEDDAHGMNCFSTIAANNPGLFVGTAPKAAFALFRTEDVATETKIEEHNMAAGFERADSLGIDVCTVSLGYTTFDFASQNYTYANMDGKTALSTIAADIAAKKGMLPVIAAGNEGQSPWRYIAAPADADSVLTVGAVDTLGVAAAFSSYGPSADGRIKPNVAAVGRNAIVASPSTGAPVYSNGTSFATPNLAGLTTCLWQAFPEFNNMTIIDAIQKASNRVATPNDRTGYGIPDMKKAFVVLQKKSYTQQVAISNCTASFTLNTKYDATMNIIVEKKSATQTNYTTFKTILGTGNFSNKNITFTDDLMNTAGANNSYRIKIEIATDTSYYLDSLNVAIPNSCANPENKISINPNPVKNNANVVISRSQTSNINIVVTNAAGQQVYQTNYKQAAGTQIKTINMQAMASGIYYITIYADDKKVKTESIFKQ